MYNARQCSDRAHLSTQSSCFQMYSSSCLPNTSWSDGAVIISSNVQKQQQHLWRLQLCYYYKEHRYWHQSSFLTEVVCSVNFCDISAVLLSVITKHQYTG